LKVHRYGSSEAALLFFLSILREHQQEVAVGILGRGRIGIGDDSFVCLKKENDSI